eukprot:GGOE01054585.1.p1 GENE.GGOE01054585.1~~GGOE01054585.1.p1  ORF type:complete len:689 (-),score=187.48 GGOE01054585.1:368-2434(-)
MSLLFPGCVSCLPPVPLVSCPPPPPQVHVQSFPVYVPSHEPPEKKQIEVRVIEKEASGNTNLQLELTDLRHQLRAAKLREVELLGEVQQLKAKLAILAELEARVASQKEENDKLHRLHLDAQRRASTAEGQLLALQGQFTKLNDRLKELQERASLVDPLTAKVSSLENELAEFQVRFRGAQSERETALNELARVTAQLAESNNAIWRVRTESDAERVRLLDEVAAIQQRLTAAFGERDMARNDASHLQEQLQQAKLSAEQRIAQMQLDFEVERAQAKHRLSEAQAATQEAELRAKDLAGQLHASRQQNTQAQIAFEAERARFQEQLFAAQSQINMLQRDYEGAHSDLLASEARISELNREIAFANQQLQQSRFGFEGEQAQMQEQLIGLQARIAGLEHDLHVTHSDLRVANGKLQDSADQLALATGRLQQAQVAWDAERSQLMEQVMAGQKALTLSQSDLQATRTDAAFWQSRTAEVEAHLEGAYRRIGELEEKILGLELEIRNLRAQLQPKVELHSQTSIRETYKVKTFEMAAKLAVMDGTDDGMYNGLPIEVEGEGLYRDLVAKGRRPSSDPRELRGSISKKETYQVQTFEMAERLSKMDGKDIGVYQGQPIEVIGEGVYNDLVRAGRRSSPASSPSASVGQTYVVPSMEMAATLSRMNAADDGTYKGMPIEVKGQGLFRELRGRR